MVRHGEMGRGGRPTTTMKGVVFTAAVIVVGCTDDPAGVRNESDLTAAAESFVMDRPGDPGDLTIQRLACYDPTSVECINTPPDGDPEPGAAGVYLGPAFSWANCVASGGQDADGLADVCEFQLAVVFRPLLVTNLYDEDKSRESYWAAKRDGNTVKIFYALAYHWDGGSEQWGCTLLNWTDDCLAHPGDAEHIVLRLSYNTATEHWELMSGYLSAHAGTLGESSETVQASGFSYPIRTKWYPRVWIARDKHANYKNRSACNNGGFADSDTCEGNYDDVQVEVLSGRNLGSSSYNYINYITSTQPFIYTGYEYFWDGTQKFCGWDGPSVYNHNRQNCSAGTSYGSILATHGF